MKELGESPEPIGSRTTLKLKTAGRTALVAPRSLPEPLVAPALPPRSPRAAKKTTDWADEHKQRMQADMDLLGLGHMPTHKGGGR